ncbi:META domain-containing protein [Cellulomonas sp. NS3]|uniref:META domain-containing protein n=1 Tax=Cellulomonas sp. NS3 TaxID=2973977 RepID=UPI002162900E|nr:META domain-containing protein [Cellulomonas sp. NS3]
MSTARTARPATPTPTGRPRARRLLGTAALPLVVVVLLAACASASGSTAGDELAGRSFESTDVEGRTLVEGTVITLIVRSDGVSVNAGCNTLFGDATWDDGVLRAPQLASTMMACDADLMDQDQWLVALLEGSVPYELDGDTLTLGAAGERITLTDVTA